MSINDGSHTMAVLYKRHYLARQRELVVVKQRAFIRGEAAGMHMEQIPVGEGTKLMVKPDFKVDCLVVNR